MGDREEQGEGPRGGRCGIAGCCDVPHMTFEEAVAWARELDKRTA